MKLHELLLSDFIDCAVDGNYASLPSPEVWEELQVEWSQLVGDAENIYQIKLLKEIILLECKITKAEVYIALLIDVHDEEVVKGINKLGIPARLYSESTREADIKFASGYCKQWKVTLEQKKKEIQSFKNEDGSKISRLYFDELIIEVSKYTGYQIKEKEISAQKFGLLLNRLKKQVKDGK